MGIPETRGADVCASVYLTRVSGQPLPGAHQWVLRPLSPDRVGIDFGDTGKVSVNLATRLLDRMGTEVAHIHLLSHDPAPLMSYLASHEPGWLGRSAVVMKEDTETDFEAWMEHRRAVDKSSHPS